MLDLRRAEKLARGAIEAENLAGFRFLLVAYGSLAAALGNPLSIDAECNAGRRAKFHAAADYVTIDWSAASETPASLASVHHAD
jgi:hypothetical protein